MTSRRARPRPATKPGGPPPRLSVTTDSLCLEGVMFTAKRNGSHCLHPPLSGCSQGPFFDTICHCLVFIFNVIMMMKDSSNSLCQLFYHGHCLLLSLYICVISLKCNGNADFCLLVSFFFFFLTLADVTCLRVVVSPKTGPAP